VLNERPSALVSDERLSAVVANTIVAIEKKSWLRSERAASLLRLVVVVAVHGAVIAALLSWSWPPAPIEVSILSLEDLGGDVSSSEEVPAQKLPAQEHAASDAQAATSSEILPAAVAPRLNLHSLSRSISHFHSSCPPRPSRKSHPSSHLNSCLRRKRNLLKLLI
jgi:hypothetical protein